MTARPELAVAAGTGGRVPKAVLASVGKVMTLAPFVTAEGATDRRGGDEVRIAGL